MSNGLHSRTAWTLIGVFEHAELLFEVLRMLPGQTWDFIVPLGVVAVAGRTLHDPQIRKALIENDRSAWTWCLLRFPHGLLGRKIITQLVDLSGTEVGESPHVLGSGGVTTLMTLEVGQLQAQVDFC